ncbi:MAG: NAD(P)H-dependent oxidoreductase subunit E [Chloroflexi bacterium]|nr:NAD(P)H-dependent oxidoreductase subunit E [Chloroflexota bacterium]
MVSRTKSPKPTKVSTTVSKVIRNYQQDKDKLIQILLYLQSTLGWLSREVLTEVSEQLQVPITQVYQIASYYKAFSLMPRGRHIIKVCLGTACQVRGSPRLLDTISAMLNLKPCETSEDMRFTLETVNCLGCCAMGPVVVVDETYHTKPSPSDLRKLFESAK